MTSGRGRRPQELHDDQKTLSTPGLSFTGLKRSCVGLIGVKYFYFLRTIKSGHYIKIIQGKLISRKYRFLDSIYYISSCSKSK